MERFQEVLQWSFHMPSLAYSFVSTTGADVQILQIQIYCSHSQIILKKI
jgi:hypothetical protein